MPRSWQPTKQTGRSLVLMKAGNDCSNQSYPAAGRSWSLSWSWLPTKLTSRRWVLINVLELAADKAGRQQMGSAALHPPHACAAQHVPQRREQAAC